MAGKSEKIIKLKHESEFTIIGNSALQDSSLSWAERGLLVYMLSLPDDWKVHERELLKHTTDKKLATHNALVELIRAGYVYKTQGKIIQKETQYFVSDSKLTRDIVENQTRYTRKSDIGISENQTTGISENQTLQSTHIQINRKKEKKRKERGENPSPAFPSFSETDVLKNRIDSLREYWNSLGLPETPKTTNRHAIGDLKDSLDFYSDGQIKEAMKNYATILEHEFFSESILPRGSMCKTYKNFIQRWVHNFIGEGLKGFYEYCLPDEGLHE
jgi:hypothetical protein